MGAKRNSRIVEQAFEWLEKMGIDVTPIPKSDRIYTFLYNDVLIDSYKSRCSRRNAVSQLARPPFW